MDILSGLTFSAPQQISAALSDIIPIISETMWDSKPEVCNNSFFLFLFHQGVTLQQACRGSEESTEETNTKDNNTTQHNNRNKKKKTKKSDFRLDSELNSPLDFGLDWTGLEIAYTAEKKIITKTIAHVTDHLHIPRFLHI